MIPAVAGALVSGASGLLGNVVSNAMNIGESQKAYDREMEIMQYQNQYNSPIAQMERYKQAGLNPNLIYGSGSVSAGNMSSTPSYKPAPQVMDNHGAQALQSYNQINSLDNTLESGTVSRLLMNQKIAQSIEQTLTEAYKRTNLEAISKKTDVERGNAQEFGKYISQVQEANLNNTLENTKLLGERIAQTKQMIRESQTNVKLKNTQTSATKAQTHLIKVNTKRAKVSLSDEEWGTAGNDFISSVGKKIKNAGSKIKGFLDNYVP